MRFGGHSTPAVSGPRLHPLFQKFGVSVPSDEAGRAHHPPHRPAQQDGGRLCLSPYHHHNIVTVHREAPTCKRECYISKVAQICQSPRSTQPQVRRSHSQTCAGLPITAKHPPASTNGTFPNLHRSANHRGAPSHKYEGHIPRLAQVCQSPRSTHLQARMVHFQTCTDLPETQHPQMVTTSSLICRMLNKGIRGSYACNTAYSPESSTMEIGRPFEYTQRAKA